MNDNTHSISVLEPAAQPQNQPTLPPSQAEKCLTSHQRRLAAWLLHAGPNVLVLVLLGGLAWWGHHTGWTIPKFSDLVGNGQQEPDDWCAEHSVPESICVECNEALMPKGQSAWCRKHGVHNCPFERPEVAQLKYPPQITKADLERAQRALDLKERSENNPKCKIHHRRLQFSSDSLLTKMGVDITPVWQAPIVETVWASGEITFEQTRVAPISAPVAGRVWLVTEQGQLGAAVTRGNLLALIDSADVGKAKVEFLQAFAQLDLKTKTVAGIKAVADQGAIPYVRVLEAETAQREAQIRLTGAQQTLVNLGLPVSLDSVKGMTTEALSTFIQFFGIPAEVAQRLDAKVLSFNLYPVLATRDGVVSATKVVPGETVDSAKTLFVVADASQMWLILNVRSEDVKFLRIRDSKTGKPGQVVKFQADGSGREVTGELVWKSLQVDDKTRTVQFRSELPNPDGALLANTFGMGHIVLREEKNAVVVPTEALHWEGDCNIVFVRDKNFLEPGAPKIFHVRTVRPGVKNGPNTEIIAGLLPGEVVATRNSANLRAELLKNNLGAG